MDRKFTPVSIAAAAILFMLMSCMTKAETPEMSGPETDDGWIAVKITGADKIFREGETALLSAETEYSGSDEIEYMWFIKDRQAGNNSDTLDIEASAYSQVPVRVIVKAGDLIAEDSVIVQWSGNEIKTGNGDKLPGSLIIASVSPDRFLVDGVMTEFTVRLSYSFPENLTADLKVIFNNGKDSSELRVNDRFSLKGGTGVYEFSVTAVPKNWEDDDFFIYLLLSVDGFNTGLSAKKVLEFK